LVDFEIGRGGVLLRPAFSSSFLYKKPQPLTPDLPMTLGFHRKPDGKRRISNRQIDFFGWVLFILSALGFIIASIGNFWAMFGSVLFLLACVVFIIPFFRKDQG
jgi:hypothetical protein